MAQSPGRGTSTSVVLPQLKNLNGKRSVLGSPGRFETPDTSAHRVGRSRVKCPVAGELAPQARTGPGHLDGGGKRQRQIQSTGWLTPPSDVLPRKCSSEVKRSTRWSPGRDETPGASAPRNRHIGLRVSTRRPPILPQGSPYGVSLTAHSRAPPLDARWSVSGVPSLGTATQLGTHPRRLQLVRSRALTESDDSQSERAGGSSSTPIRPKPRSLVLLDHLGACLCSQWTPVSLRAPRPTECWRKLASHTFL